MKLRSLSAVLFALLLAWSGAAAQVVTTGTIEVLVEDQDGGRLPGVTVVARAADTVTTRTAVTNDEGVAVLEGLAPSNDYTLTAELTGFQERSLGAVLVRSGQTASVRFTLPLAGVTEQVQVTAQSPLVDVKSATTSQDITLELTESLPTGRSYQSYLQIVPGVLPDDPTLSGNPAVRSGVNYSDIRGDLGVSSDNVYYFDAINVTDPVTGTFGANLNTEIIQEQRVITGGIAAEFVGTPGLISNVVTKSGSNRFSGSVNYFFQNENLQAENENGPDDVFSTDDNGYTIGGPIFPDKAWFFGSYRFFKRADDVSTLDTNEFLRSVDNTQHQGFVKGSYGFTSSDLASFTYLSDPTDLTGRRDRDITNARDESRDQGGHRYSASYNRVWGGALLELGWNKHNGEVSRFSAIRESQNDAIFQESDVRSLTDEQLGGFGQDLINQRDTQAVRGSLSYNWGRHTFKGGLDWTQHVNFRDTLFVDGATFTTLAPRYAGAGITAADVASGDWTALAFDHTNSSDFGGFIRAIEARPDRARFFDAFDLNRDGGISQEELGEALTFTEVKPDDGTVFYDRTFQSSTGPQETESQGVSFFVQDQVSLDRWTFNVGMRAERWEHVATTGENIFTFDWEFAPRLSAAFDITGNGRHKATAYYGRYYDPIRNNMTNFAGTLTGSILEEQVFALGEWITYRTRGGPVQQDAFFAPTTQTPYVDDLQFGYETDLGNNLSFGATYFNRRTRDILEDYDLALYAFATDGSTDYPGDINHPDSLWLGLDYFGYTENPGSNFVIATLEGGERNHNGLELVLRKRFSDRWQMLSSYTFMTADGNSNSDSNADFQGDVLFLDPRAPNQDGDLPGTISHIFKVAGSYTFDFGLQLGAFYNWNSGTWASRTFSASNRNLPIRVETGNEFGFAGFDNRWIAPGTVGVLRNPSYGTLDTRIEYNLRWMERLSTEFFVDIFNITNKQGAIREQDLVAGSGGNPFGDPIQWVLPRRAFVGARLGF